MKSSRRLMLILSTLSIAPLLLAAAIFGISAWIGAPSEALTEILDLPSLLTLFLLAIVCCVAVASSLSRRIFEQLNFLTRLGESVGEGKHVTNVQEQHLYEELRPLYHHLKDHTKFHREINEYLKNLLGNSPPSGSIELRSKDDDFIKALNAFISRFRHIQQVIHAVSERNLALLEDMDENTLGPLISTHTLITELNNLSSEAQFYIEKLLRTASQIGSISNQSSQDTVSVTRRVNDILQAILKMTGTMQTLAGYVQERSLHREENSQAVQQLMTSIESIASELEELKELFETNSTTHEISRKMQSSLERIHATNAFIRSDAEHSSQLTQEAMKHVYAGQEMMERAVEGIHGIKQSLNGFFDIVNRLGERSEEVIETLEVISDVADHTNLLAINAAIISAHAGEHGRDFAVIADEIGKFAERTKESADEIENLLKRIRTDFEEATQAMDNSSKAMSQGLEWSLHAGKALETIATGFESGADIALKLAESATQQAQDYDHLRQAVTEQDKFHNARHDEFKQLISQLLQLSEKIRRVSANQAEQEAGLSESIEKFELVTKGLSQATEQQVDAGQQLIEATQYVQKLTQRTNLGIEKATQLSTELVTIGGNLAFTIGEFTLSKAHVPPSQQNVPCIGFIKRSVDTFFNMVLQGVKSEAAQHGLEVIELDSNNEATKQVENVNTLLKHPMLQGIILCPTDINVAKKLVQKGSAQGIAFVAADETIATTLSVRSSNREGGRNAAKLFMRHLQPNAAIGIFTERTIESMTKRALGFRQKAEQYPFDLIELYCDMSSPEALKDSLKSALDNASGLQGIFLTNEELTCAYLNLLREGQLSERQILAVGYDRTPAIEQAILEGKILGAIMQQPEEIGRQAFNLLHKLIKKQIRLDEVEERTIYLSTRTVTRETLST